MEIMKDWRNKGPAFFLWLIRDGKISSVEEVTDLMRMGGVTRSSREYYRLRNKLYGFFTGFINAGLVEEKDGKLAVTPLLQKVQDALNLSLTELIERPQSSLWVNPLFGPPDSGAAAPDIFVLMPFASELQPVYGDHIKKVAGQLGLSVARADDFFTSNAIIQDIWNAIFLSKVIVADCTGRNPNVFYEIGIAHTLGRRVVLVTQALEDIPFDLRHLRVVEYSFTPRGMLLFEEVLLKAISSQLPNGEATSRQGA